MTDIPTSSGTDRFTRPEDDAGSTGAKDQAQQAAQEGAEKAKGALRSQVDQRSTTIGETVSTQASDVRTIADSLREQGKEQPAKIAEQAADKAEQLGGYLKDSDADRILSDVEDFARRNPWSVVAGGLAAGFLASRFLKASSSQRSTNGSPSRSQLPARTGTATGVGLGAPQRTPASQTAVSPTPPPAPTSTPPVTSPVAGVPAGTGTTSVPGRGIG